MNRAAFLFLFLIPSFSHCSEEEQGLIKLDTVNIESVGSQINEPIRNSAFSQLEGPGRSRKIIKRVLYLSTILMLGGMVSDAFSGPLFSLNPVKPVAFALPLNVTHSINEYECSSYPCFCHTWDSANLCICCSEVVFPEQNEEYEKCLDFIYAHPEEKIGGVTIRQCKERVSTNYSKLASTLVSMLSRPISVLLTCITYNHAKYWMDKI